MLGTKEELKINFLGQNLSELISYTNMHHGRILTNIAGEYFNF
jgi:hypothetical protein